MIDPISFLGKANPWIVDRLAFVCRSGSMAYGTNTPDSDEDFKGFSFGKKEHYLGYQKNFEQQELKAPNPDITIYEIKKFFALAAANNPSIIEVLFTDPSDYIFVSKAGEKVLEHRNKFLSKRVRNSFAGYARSQLNKIKTHRKWLLNPIEVKPDRKDFGLKDRPFIDNNQLLAVKSEIKKELEKYNLSHMDELRDDQKIALQNNIYDILSELHITKDIQWEAAARKIGLSENFIEAMQKENAYERKLLEYNQYQNWKATRNPKRSELEKKCGYDSKNLYHLVRLYRMAEEIVETGNVLVKRPDAKELLEIRGGSWEYEYIIDFSNAMDKKLDIICAKSKAIPGKPDEEFLDNLCIELIEEELQKEYNKCR